MTLHRVAALHGQDQGQGGFAFAQVIAQIFPHFCGIAVVVKHIIDDLKSCAEGLAVVCTSVFDGCRASGQDGTKARTGFKQFGCFGPDDPQIALFVERGVVHVHQLKHFSFGDHIGGIGQGLHDPHAFGVHHHLEGPGVQKVADQHAGRISEIFIGRRPAAPQGGFVHHIVVQQSGRVDELNHSCQVVALCPGISQSAASQQQKHRAKAFPTRRDDVTRHFAYQGHARIEPMGDHPVDLGHVGGHQVENGGGAVFRGRQVGYPAGDSDGPSQKRASEGRDLILNSL